MALRPSARCLAAPLQPQADGWTAHAFQEGLVTGRTDLHKPGGSESPWFREKCNSFLSAFIHIISCVPPSNLEPERRGRSLCSRERKLSPRGGHGERKGQNQGCTARDTARGGRCLSHSSSRPLLGVVARTACYGGTRLKSFQTKATPDILSSVHSSLFNALQTSLLLKDPAVKRKGTERCCHWVGNAGVRKPSCHTSFSAQQAPNRPLVPAHTVIPVYPQLHPTNFP